MGVYKKLIVWQKANELTLGVYRATAGFPRDEIYGLTSQIRRASASIPANIAEGCGRNRERELSRFLQIALGSANELEYHIFLASELGILPENDFKTLNEQLDHVKRMLANFNSNLKTQLIANSG